MLKTLLQYKKNYDKLKKIGGKIMSNYQSLVISFPSFPEIKGEYETTKSERLALYDIITEAFSFKYTYEKAKLAGKAQNYADKDLNKIKVYSYFLNKINNSVYDSFLRKYVIDTVAHIKNNDFNLISVRKTYETFNEWFVPGSLKGNIFRNNLATGNYYKSIDFEQLFRICNTQAVTENYPPFNEIKDLYESYRKNYEDLIK